VLALQALPGGELLVPLPLQATSHQAMLGRNGAAAAACKVRLVAGTLQAQLPLPVNALSTRLQALKCLKRNSHAGVRASRKACATAVSMPPRMNWQVGAPIWLWSWLHS
jgi:hypothetical protein